MPLQPGRGDVHVDAALTNISVAFMQDASHFIAAQVFPEIPVTHRSDDISRMTVMILVVMKLNHAHRVLNLPVAVSTWVRITTLVMCSHFTKT